MSGGRPRLSIGELCAGYGGLGMGVAQVLDAEVAWYSEIDKGALKILEHRFAGVPNIGDMTVVDWATVPEVDVLCAGYPCQPFSHAGKRKGADDSRHLWPHVREAIRHLRPRLTVLENVSGHRSLGFDRVLGDLAEDGLHVVWTSVRASDVGAPHRRERLFIGVADTEVDPWRVEHRDGATPADTNERRRGAARWDDGVRSAGLESGHRPLLPTPAAYDGDRGGPQHPDKRRDGGHSVTLQDAVHGLLPTPTTRDWKGQNQRQDSTCLPGALMPTPRATDGTKGGPNQRGSSGDLMLPSAVTLLPTPAVNDMGAAYTPDTWDAWTDSMKAEHDNGNGHGKSLSIEAQRLASPSSIVESMHARAAETGPREDLRDVRVTAGTEAFRERPTRGPDGVPQAPELLPGMREHPRDGDAIGSCLQGEAIPQEGVRALRDGSAVARPSQGRRLGERRPNEPQDALRQLSPETALGAGSPGTHGCCEASAHNGGCPWGVYSAAIHQWEIRLGRLAPEPTSLSKRGTPQLSARFSEFMMGLPAGWVTDTPGITRNEALRALGNGVVPQQAAAAVGFLLDVLDTRMTAASHHGSGTSERSRK